MKFLCWMCGLWQGYEDAPQGPSKICDACKASYKRHRETA